MTDPDDAWRPIPGVPTDRSLIDLLDDLRREGFERDMFVTADGRVRCGTCHHDAAPADLELHAIRRLEGASDPADEAAVLALSCTVCGSRGTAVLRYGPEASPQEIEVFRAVVDHRP